MHCNSTTYGHSIRCLLRYSVSIVLAGRLAEYPDCISLREGAEEAAELKRDRFYSVLTGKVQLRLIGLRSTY